MHKFHHADVADLLLPQATKSFLVNFGLPADEECDIKFCESLHPSYCEGLLEYPIAYMYDLCFAIESNSGSIFIHDINCGEIGKRIFVNSSVEEFSQCYRLHLNLVREKNPDQRSNPLYIISAGRDLDQMINQIDGPVALEKGTYWRSVVDDINRSFSRFDAMEISDEDSQIMTAEMQRISLSLTDEELKDILE